MSNNPFSLDSFVNGGLVITTDLEPDDCVAIEMILRKLFNRIIAELAGAGTLLSPRVSILMIVGEGKVDKTILGSSIYSTIYSEFLSAYFDGDTETLNNYIQFEVVQGTKSVKDYPEDALTAYGTDATYVNDLDDMPAYRYLELFMIDHPASGILALKPARDLIRTNFDFNQTQLCIYGSFNFRCLFDEFSHQQVEMFLNSFASVRLFESYHAIGSANTITIENNPDVFATMSDGSLKICQVWNHHIARNCAQKLETLSPKITNDIRNNDTKMAQETIERAHRSFKIIQNILGSDYKQMVLADYGLVACMINPTLGEIIQGDISFDNHGYTNITPNATGKINLITKTDRAKLIQTIYESLVH
jgi:hypothetical protein